MVVVNNARQPADIAAVRFFIVVAHRTAFTVRSVLECFMAGILVSLPFYFGKWDFCVVVEKSRRQL